MAVLFIKEFPDELQRKLKNVAGRHLRSMAKQALVLLEEALDRSGPAEPLRAKKLPKPFKGRFPLTAEFVNRAKREGRTRSLSM